MQQLQFLGATHTVTGSKYLLSVAGKKILIDCGLFQGLKELRLRNWEELPVDPHSIDAVIITHAHIDHTGYLPLLVKNGFSGKIYCTKATKELCAILLLDCGYLQEEEAARANRYGYTKHAPALPLYTKADAEVSLKQLVDLKFHQDYELFDGVTLRFSVAGHILGAATVLLKFNDTSILFSGDVGRQNDPCMPAPETNFGKVDYLVVESTYGDRPHENIDPQEQLREVINRTVHRGGTVLIPAFAVGRTQNILYYINQLKLAGSIPNIPIFVDSPMARNVSAVVLQHAQELGADHHQDYIAACGIAHYVNKVEESKLIDTYNYPKIIISASGMVTGGRVLHHITALGGDARNTILFSGYQAAGTRGEALLSGKREIRLFGESVEINAEIVSLSNISAHADYLEMLIWLKQCNIAPRKVFITHGEPPAAEALREKITSALGWQCVIPDYLQVEEL